MATTDEIMKSYKSAVEDALSHIGGSRVGQTVIGGAKNSLASDVNSGATIYDLTQGGRDRVISEHLSAYEDALKYAQRDLAQLLEDGASARDIADQRAIVDDFQRKYDAMSLAGAVQRNATQATYQLADDIKDSAAASIAKAKDGLNAAERTAVDVGALMTEIGLDRVKSSLLIKGLGSDYKKDEFLEKLADTLKLAPLAARSYGNNSRIARLDGADTASSALYGLSIAISDAYIEDALDGLAGAYGIGRWENVLKAGFSRFRNNPTSQKLFDYLAKSMGEGAESFAGSLIRQSLKSLYNGKDGMQNIYESDFADALYNTMVDMVISSLANGSKEAKNLLN